MLLNFPSKHIKEIVLLYSFSLIKVKLYKNLILTDYYPLQKFQKKLGPEGGGKVSLLIFLFFLISLIEIIIN